MVSNKDTLFKYYDLVGTEQNNFVARFTSKREALLALKWINEQVFGFEYAKMQVQNVNYNNIWEYKSQHVHGITFKTAKEYILYIKKRTAENESAVYYNCKTDGMAFVKVNNYWWEFDTKTPLNKATVYNRVGGRMTELDLTNKNIVEAKDWQYLDWSGTCVLNNQLQTGWLSPDGVLFGCDYRCHSTQAEYVHKKHENELEIAGWVKLTYNYGNTNELMAYFGRDTHHRLIPPTDKQMDYLLKCKLYNKSDVEYYYNLRYNDDNLIL